jgi:hypothetical protein
MYLKYSDKPQKRLIHIKKFITTHIPKWVVFQFNWKNLLTINTLTMYHFNYNWNVTFTPHVQSLMTLGSYCLSSHKSQEMLKAYQLYHYQFTPWIRLITNCRTTSTSRSGCEWIDRHKNFVDKVSLHFQLELNTLGLLSVHIDENLKDWGQQIAGLYLANCLRTHRVGYARTNVIGSKTSFVIASVCSRIRDGLKYMYLGVIRSMPTT